MKFTFLVFEQGYPRGRAPLFPPATLDFPSVEEAREVAKKYSGHESARELIIEIDSEDGSVSERWYRQLTGWQRSDA